MDFHDRYWIGGYSTYYPVGFLGDVRYTTNCYDEAEEFLKLVSCECTFIWDSAKCEYAREEGW